MGLFDGQPLTREELIQVETKRRQADGSTIRTLSSRGPGEPVWRTVRHRPWHEIVGNGPDGKTCGDCSRLLTRGKYFKCGEFKVTCGAGTDIRKKDPACKLFEAAGGGHETLSREV